MHSSDMGKPNRAVQTVLGVLVLIDDVRPDGRGDVSEEPEFNRLWHHALRLEMEEAHLAQKTLHNFRARLMEHDGGRLAYCETTDRIIEAMGVRTGKQRLRPRLTSSSNIDGVDYGWVCSARRSDCSW